MFSVTLVSLLGERLLIVYESPHTFCWHFFRFVLTLPTGVIVREEGGKSEGENFRKEQKKILTKNVENGGFGKGINFCYLIVSYLRA